MALNCDCYPGCWGDHAKEWPTIDDPHKAVVAFLNKASDVMKYIRYGEYVLVDGKLHVKDEATKKKVEEFFGVVRDAVLRPAPSAPLEGETPTADTAYEAAARLPDNEAVIAMYEVAQSLERRLRSLSPASTEKPAQDLDGAWPGAGPLIEAINRLSVRAGFPVVENYIQVLETIGNKVERLDREALAASTDKPVALESAVAEHLNELRDVILNERYSLAEAGFSSDQINAVLAELDDYHERALNVLRAAPASVREPEAVALVREYRDSLLDGPENLTLTRAEELEAKANTILGESDAA